MSDTSLNKIIQYGTNAAMMAFTPSPAIGSQVLYLWEDTDNPGDLYMWDGAAWVLSGSGGGITQLTGDVTAGPGSGSQAATIANNAVSTAKVADDAITYAKIQNVSNTDRLLGRDTAGAGDTEELQVADGIEFSGTPGIRLTTDARTRKITFVFNDMTVGSKCRVTFPVAGTITGNRIFSDVSGSAVVDIWKDTWANYPPTIADTITASAKPTLSSQTHVEDTTLTGWTTAISAGDVLFANLDSFSGVGQVVVELTIVI